MNFEVLHILSQSIGTLLINLIIFMFFNSVYTPRYKNKLYYVLTFAVWTLVMYGVNYINFAPLNLAYMFLSSEIICIKMYNATFKNSLLYNILLMFLILLSDTLSYFIWTIFFEKGFNEIAADDKLMIVSNFLNIMLFFFSTKVLLAVIEKHELKEIKVQESVFLFLATIFESFVVYRYMINVNSKESGMTVFVIVLGFLVFNLYITYIIRKTVDLYKYKYDAELLTKLNEMQLEHYRELDGKYQDTRQIIHDMKKHLLVISELNGTENERAADYSNVLEKRLDSLFCDFKCSNPILSIVISQKYALAEKKGITVKTDVEDVDISFIEDLDITGIFTNLWDNAIEACNDVDVSEREINFVMKKVSGFILVNIENSYDKDKCPSLENETMLSTKENHMGVGLSVIKKLVEKYGGLFNPEATDEKFVIELTIPVPI